MMGNPKIEEGRNISEGPVHEVRLSSFMIAKHEVTQAHWAKVMGRHPSHFKGENLPVEQVSWNDCQEFCSKTDLKLPTEAQWEYACRAGNDGPYAGIRKLDEIGWYDENSSGTTHAVGTRKPNDFGLFDMHGNVWEWCEDVFDAKFYSKPEASKQDPVCTSGSVSRLLRGGSRCHDAGYCCSAARGRYHPSNHFHILGFRPSFFPLSE